MALVHRHFVGRRRRYAFFDAFWRRRCGWHRRWQVRSRLHSPYVDGWRHRRRRRRRRRTTTTTSGVREFRAVAKLDRFRLTRGNCTRRRRRRGARPPGKSMHRPVVELKPQRDGREVLICRLRLRRLSKRDKAQTSYYLQEEEERTTASSDDDTDAASDAAAARRSQDVRRHVVLCSVVWGPPGLDLFLRLRGDTLLGVNSYPSSVGNRPGPGPALPFCPFSSAHRPNR